MRILASVLIARIFICRSYLCLTKDKYLDTQAQQSLS